MKRLTIFAAVTALVVASVLVGAACATVALVSDELYKLKGRK